MKYKIKQASDKNSVSFGIINIALATVLKHFFTASKGGFGLTLKKLPKAQVACLINCLSFVEAKIVINLSKAFSLIKASRIFKQSLDKFPKSQVAWILSSSIEESNNFIILGIPPLITILFA